MTWDVFSAIAATTPFHATHPHKLHDPSKHVGTSIICASECKLLSIINCLALSAESAKISSISLEAWPSQNLVCSVNVFLDNEHNPRMLLNFLSHCKLGHVHKYETAFGCGVDILMAATFLSIVLFQKQNQKMI